MVWTLNFTVRDSDPDRASFRINLPGATSQANVVAFAQSFAALVDQAIEGVIENIQATLSIALPAGLRGSTTNSDVEHGARLTFETSGGFATSFRLPTIADSQLVGHEVLQSTTEMAAIIAAMVSGLSGVSPCDARGEDITGIVSAVESFRAS